MSQGGAGGIGGPLDEANSIAGRGVAGLPECQAQKIGNRFSSGLIALGGDVLGGAEDILVDVEGGSHTDSIPHLMFDANVWGVRTRSGGLVD